MLFFSVTFIIFFALFSFFRFLASWIESVRIISQDPEHGGVLLAAVKMALPAALFFTILLSLSYSVRRKIPAVFSILIVFVFAGVFSFCFYLGIERVHVYDPSLEIPESLSGKTGLILSRLETDIILLSNDGNKTGGPRVISFPERPLLYQETVPGPSSSAVALPLDTGTPWFIRSIIMDFALVTREFDARRAQGWLPFLFYTASLFFLLVSLRFLFASSNWPMANLFLGALAFRLILSLVIFLRTWEAGNFLNTFVNNRLPGYLISPAVFGILGALIILYTFLTFMARRIRRDDV